MNATSPMMPTIKKNDVNVISLSPIISASVPSLLPPVVRSSGGPVTLPYRVLFLSFFFF
jgi:hypothetical protein